MMPKQARPRALPLALLIPALLAAGLMMAPLSAPQARAAPVAAPTRPAASVAEARIALVRVLSYYIGQTPSSGPVPVQTACAADGALVGTTGSGLNSYDYVLVPTAVVNPITPCQGVRAAFQVLYGASTGWTLSRITVLLNVAYTGTALSQAGSIAYSIDPAEITTDGGSSGPPLLALTLSAGHGAPSHDLPVLAVPQPSDAPATGVAHVLDLTGPTGALLGRDSLLPSESATALYPVDEPAAGLPGLVATPAPASGSSTGATGGTPAPTSAATSAATAAPASALAAQLGLGAPIINSNGRLIGMIVAGSDGQHVAATQAMVTAAIGAVTGQPGPLMTTWQAGLTAYYATPPGFGQAAADFATLRSSDPDFAGVAPWADAARRHSTTIPALIQTPTTATGGATNAGQPAAATARRVPLVWLVAAGLAVLLLLAALAVLALARQRRRRARPALPPPDEAGLDLLPREMMSGTPAIAEQPTERLPVVAPATNGAGLAAAALRPAAARGEPTPRRAGITQAPLAAGLSDPGTKRRHEPNQDGILAVVGLRPGRQVPQPFGLFVVADGMGGHDAGQDASRLAIESIAHTLLPALASPQPLDDATLAGLLRQGTSRAHATLRQHNVEQHADMGTTITAALVLEGSAQVANVGDSRTYLMSPDLGLRQITTDHSVVASLVAAGVIRAEDIYSHPRRNQIYRSLGGADTAVELDTFRIELQPGDKLLLCSDGLWEMVRDPQIEHILRATADPRQAAELLVREANTNGGEDNIGVVVVRMVEEAPQQAQLGMRVIAAPPGAQLAPR